VSYAFGCAENRLTRLEKWAAICHITDGHVAGAASPKKPVVKETRRQGNPMAEHQPVIETVFHKLGGRSALGMDVFSDADLARVVHRGIHLKVLGHLGRAGFSKQEIHTFVIPARTWRHRAARKEPLTIEESDRVVRLARIQASAEDVFGDKPKANRWLREPLGVLDDKSPLELAQTESGARLIEQLLAKIDWGAAA
jgi:putative toxin-antitoxin system antitoxin component (TIGR02293 family)